MSELLLILWAGGAALLSYSLVYALRKPYTAASFEGLTLFGTDYTVAVTTWVCNSKILRYKTYL